MDKQQVVGKPFAQRTFNKITGQPCVRVMQSVRQPSHSVRAGHCIDRAIAEFWGSDAMEKAEAFIAGMEG